MKGNFTISGNIAITVPATAYPLNVPHLGNTGGSAGFLDALDRGGGDGRPALGRKRGLKASFPEYGAV
jgi:hypothetical protein